MSAVVGASASAGSGRAGRRKEQLPLLRGELLSPKSGEGQVYWSRSIVSYEVPEEVDARPPVCEKDAWHNMR